MNIWQKFYIPAKFFENTIINKILKLFFHIMEMTKELSWVKEKYNDLK